VASPRFHDIQANAIDRSVSKSLVAAVTTISPCSPAAWFATTTPKEASVSRWFSCTNQAAAFVCLLVEGDAEGSIPKPLIFLLSEYR
jgi:hypothetical protein